MSLTLVLLAAGMGSRYGGLKQLDQLGPHGETLMDYSVYDALQAGFDKVVFIIRRDIEDEFKRVIGQRYEHVVNLDYAFQDLNDIPAPYQVPADRTKPWGTGHALYAARHIVKEPFAVINADDFYGAASYRSLAQYLKQFDANSALKGCMCGYHLVNTLSENGSVSRGICSVDDAGNLAKVVEHTKLAANGSSDLILSTLEDGSTQQFSGETLVSMNCWGFTPQIFGEIERMLKDFLAERGNELKSEFYIPYIADRLIREGRTAIKMLTSDAKWFGVTYREDRPVTVAALQKMSNEGRYPEKLF